ncbi:unnamed protein product [Vitrella brassicaformis CCMP3155]|uniref:Acyltransferase n=1 Tax=Vitrella brassicaformis (strain CCMP3155) TaxID=1169540 RepID=A0A0G4GQ43_VITBC|nr:unnamed protein product [Vitrella brassicaformis CCMP3155]|eukprot:CEM32489.1 unnamed protein product [Vitrella brassicaformis CCMP3155]
MAVCAFIASLYITVPLLCVVLIIGRLYFSVHACGYLLLVLVSMALLPAVDSRALRTSWVFLAVAKYFSAEILHDVPAEELLANPKRYLVAIVPHGLISFGGLSAAAMDPPIYGPTAAAEIVLRLPFLRHIFGVFSMIRADKTSIVKTLKRDNVIVYTGGIAELFLSDRRKEELYLLKRKGFIRAAIAGNADILPVYLFGNTQMYEVSHARWIQVLSRTLRMSLCVYWGRFFSFVPFRTKVLFAVGKPIKVNISPDTEPTQLEVDLYHDRFVNEIKRLFDTYKEDLPAYKDKTLTIT